jgi:hypothetical protein
MATHPGTPDCGSQKSPATPSTAGTTSLAPLPWPVLIPDATRVAWLFDRLVDEAEPGDEQMLAWAEDLADVLDELEQQRRVRN